MVTRILVAEPDECIAEAFSKALARKGFEVTTASTEQECMRHLCESAPDVVVLEPDRIGSWGRKILEKGGRIPLVVVSRFSPQDADVMTGIQWLTKPVSTEHLVSALKVAVPNHAQN